MKTFMGYEVQDALDHTMRRARILFDKQIRNKGLDPKSWNPIVFEGSRAYTDGVSIHLPNVSFDARVTTEEFKNLQAYAIHEIGHCIFSDFMSWGQDSQIKRMHNAVEDLWMEHKIIESGLIPGAAELIQGLVKTMIGPEVNWLIPENYAFGLVVHGRGLPTGTPKAILEIFDRYLPVIFSSSGTPKNLVIAQQIIDEINQLAEQQQDQQQDSDSEPSDPDSDSDGDPDSDSDNDSDQVQTIDPDMKGGEEVEPSLELDPAKTDTSSFQTNQKDDDWDFGHGDNALNVAAPARLRYEVAQLFDNTDRSGYSYGHRSGVLDVNRLSQYRSDPIFSRREDPDQIDSAVVLLIDLSSSMSGIINIVANTAYAFAQAFSIPFAVIGFSDSVQVLKDWTTPVARFRTTCQKLSCLGGTRDYTANRFAQTMIMKRPERNKVVFVLTDGLGDVSTRDQVETGKRLGVKTFGVGIGLNVSNVYPRAVLVRDVTDLGRIMFSKFKEAA